MEKENNKEKYYKSDVKFFIFLSFVFGIIATMLFNQIIYTFGKNKTMTSFEECHSEFYQDFYVGDIKDLDILKNCIERKNSIDF